MATDTKMSLIETEFLEDKDYLSRPTKKLLEDFGQGNHIPGSGSAAILSALLGIEMMKTVIKLTRTKEDYKSVHEAFGHYLQVLDAEYKPRLIALFNDDIREFHKVSYHRRQRDKAFADHDDAEFENHKKLAVEQLKIATDIPLEVCKINVALMNIAKQIFDNGFRSARGDAGVAISNLLSALSGCLYVIFLNLKTFKGGKWKAQKMEVAIRFLQEYEWIHKDAYSRIVNLYNESNKGAEESLNVNQLNLFN